MPDHFQLTVFVQYLANINIDHQSFLKAGVYLKFGGKMENFLFTEKTSFTIYISTERWIFVWFSQIKRQRGILLDEVLSDKHVAMVTKW